MNRCIGYSRLLPINLLIILVVACGQAPQPTLPAQVSSPRPAMTETKPAGTSTATEISATPVPPTPKALPSETVTSTQSDATQASAYICTDPLGCLKLEPGDPMHFAYLLVLSGDRSSLGVDSRNGIEIAIDDIGGTILGHMVVLTGKDSGCDNNTAVAAAQDLVSDPTIVAIIGPSCSGEARAANPVLSAAGMVIISPSNTGIDLTDPNSQFYVSGYFRTAPSDEYQATTAADYAYNQLGARSAATIDEGGSYATTLQEIFSSQFTRLGGTITLHTSITSDARNFRQTLSTIASVTPDLIYMPVFMPAAAYIIEQARSTIGLENTWLMGSDALYSYGLSSAISSAVEGFMVTYPRVQGSAYEAFLDKYVAKFGKQPINIFHAHAYDAFNILKAAIEKVAFQETDGTIYIPRQALRNAVSSTKDFPGVTGNLSCNIKGDCANPVVGVYVYHTDRFPPEEIWPLP